jgi:hypothetical protein
VELTQSQIDRFWSRVDRPDDPTACWLWQGSTDAAGYGRLVVGGKRLAAHRVSLELATGQPIPPGQMVRHVVCNTPGCVRPDHLALGDHAANMADRQAAGRQARGERSGRARLTTLKVAALRALFEAGWAIAALADIFDTSAQQAYRVITGRQWSHVPLTPEQQAAAATRIAPAARPGAANFTAKLTEQQVRAIRHQAQEGIRVADLARHYRVSETCIRRVVTRQTWRDVPDLPPDAAPAAGTVTRADAIAAYA